MNDTGKYPLLEAILAIKNLPLQPMYSTRSIAEIFGVSARSIDNRMSSGQLISRNSPGRTHSLPEDLEAFLRSSKKPKRGGH
jgi:hypothetical protein